MMKKARKASFGGSNGNLMNHILHNPNNARSPAQHLHELQETTRIAKDHHLLSPYVMRMLLPHQPIPAIQSNTEFLAANFIQTIGQQQHRPSSSFYDTENNNRVDHRHTIVNLSSSGNNIIMSDIGGGDGGVSSSTIPLGNNNDRNTASTTTIRIHDTAYILALFCNDALWDDVADLAFTAAEMYNLEMDVNKQVVRKKKQQRINSDQNNKTMNVHNNIPSPSDPTCDQPPDLPPGMGMHALTFIFGVALRKYFSIIHDDDFTLDNYIYAYKVIRYSGQYAQTYAM
jgi:hypothetical protein